MDQIWCSNNVKNTLEKPLSYFFLKRLLVNGNPSLFDIVFASLSEPTLFPYSSEVLLELYSRPESLTTASNALATRLCFDRVCVVMVISYKNIIF